MSRCLKEELFIFAKNVNADCIPLFPNCCVELPSLLFLRGAVGGEATKEGRLQTPVVLQAFNTSLFTAGMELTLISAARGQNKLDAASLRLHNKTTPITLKRSAAKTKQRAKTTGFWLDMAARLLQRLRRLEEVRRTSKLMKPMQMKESNKHICLAKDVTLNINRAVSSGKDDNK